MGFTEKDYEFVKRGYLIANDGELAAIARGAAPEVYVHVFKTYEVPKKMRDAAKSRLISYYKAKGFPDLSVKILLMHDRVIPHRRVSASPETVLTNHKGYDTLYVLAKENLTLSQAERLTDKYSEPMVIPMRGMEGKYAVYVMIGTRNVLAPGQTASTVLRTALRKPAAKKKAPARRR